MNLLRIALVSIGAAVTSYAVITLILNSSLGRRAVDVPNARSLHSVPTPRIGGLGIWAGVALPCAISPDALLLPLEIATIILITLSLFDDLMNLSVVIRLVIQLLAAAAVVAFFPTNWWMELLAVLAIVWMSNLWNFMDGIDGLSGGMAMIGYAACSIGSWQAGAPAIAYLSTAIAAASASFLLFNFSPARIFMGDVGSVPLGFVAATLGYIGFSRNVWPIWFPVTIFSPFIVDATVTLIRRLLRGEKVWVAHRSHFYQRMAMAGLGHAQTAKVWYAAMLLVAAGALAVRKMPLVWMIAFLAILTAGYLLAIFVIERTTCNEPE